MCRSNALIMGALLLAACASQAQGAPEEEALLPLLAGFEWELPEDRVRTLPPTAYQGFMRIAADRERAPYIRERALVVLSLYPNDEVLTFLTGEVGQESSRIFRRHLAVAMCRAFGSTRPAAIVERLGPMLRNPDPHLRIRVAKCLRRLGSPQARELLARYREAITEAWERDASATE